MISLTVPKEGHPIQKQLAIRVAPFGTPPVSPTLGKNQMAFPRRSRRPGTGDSSATIPDRGNAQGLLSLSSTPSGDSAYPAGRKQNYAWTLLADHLRLPDHAMGLVEGTSTPGGGNLGQAADTGSDPTPVGLFGSSASFRTKVNQSFKSRSSSRSRAMKLGRLQLETTGVSNLPHGR